MAEQKDMNNMEETVEEAVETEETVNTAEAEANAEEEAQEDVAEAETEDEADADDDQDTEGVEEEGKSFFKKKAKTDKKQEALKQKVDELEDRVKRQMAEFDNFRKRTEKEKTAMFETGAKSVIEKMLPVVDNF